MDNIVSLMNFFKGKKVLITGHTGFKGTWMTQFLLQAGAEVTGYALQPPTDPNLFILSKISDNIDSIEGDIRDLVYLDKIFQMKRPEIVIHMAAQPLVRESYQKPVYTYQVNVMGTVNVLECCHNSNTVKSIINVTTDKVYKNKEWCWGYRENEELNGFDPYSNSKSCSELVTSSYFNSFLKKDGKVVSTVRAGNVIGGGDFAYNRIIPDCVRAVQEKREIVVRNPYSIRPYEHVLEPVVAYLMIAAAQYENGKVAGSYNVGPEEKDCLTTGELVSLFCREWKSQTNEEIHWVNQCNGGPHEANSLRLDCSKIKAIFGWHPRWDIEKTMEKLVEWYSLYITGGDLVKCMERQIEEFTKKG